MNEFLEKEEKILRMLKTVFDPEIPVNVYDLGLIYGIELKDDGVCDITMTLTAPSCPAGDFIVEDIRRCPKKPNSNSASSNSLTHLTL